MSSDLDQRENSSSSDSRSRSNSESQFKSTRAEKRMGRLFKPPSSSSSSSSQIKAPSSGSTSISNTIPQQPPSTTIPSSSTQKLDKQQLQLEELKFHVARNLRSMNQQQASQSSIQPQSQQSLPSSNNSNSAQPPPPSIQQPSSESHSNSSSISSQNGSSSASSNSTQATAASSQSATQAQPQMTRKSSLSQFVFPNSLAESQTHPSMVKLGILRENAGSPKAVHRHSNYSTNSSSSNNPKNIDINDLIKISKKFKFITKEISEMVSKIGFHNDLNLPLHNLDIIIDRVSKKTIEQEVDESLRTQLVSALGNTMIEVISTLNRISISHLMSSSINPEPIRLAYFSLFSLLVELVNICKIIEPGYKPISITPNSSNNSYSSTSALKFTTSRSINPIQLSQPPSSLSTKARTPTPLIARASAPNPQANNNNTPIPMRQSSLSTSNVARQPLKIDTSMSSISRQDSELSAIVDLNDDTKFYDLLEYTTQCAQIVFSQLNNAISKSAIASAQSASSSSSKEQNSSEQKPDANIATMVKELTTHCVGAMEQTKRAKASLHAVRIATSVDGDQQRRLYEETSLFLKSIISILGATRKAILEIPELNEVRSALSNLTRATKELTIRLETSTLKQSVMNNVTSTANLVEQPPLSAIPSVANFQNGLLTGLQTSSQQHFFSGDGTSTPILGNMLSSPMITSAPPSAISHPSMVNPKSNLTPDTKDNQLSYLSINTNSAPSSTPDTKTLPAGSTKNQSYLTSKPSKLYLPTLPLQTLDPNNSNYSLSSKSAMIVTTPLVASIGPTVASAVLPMASPLQNNTSVGGISGNVSSPGFSVGNEEREHNPFERMMALNNQQQQQ